MLTLHVKGNVTNAMYFAKKHGIEVTNARKLVCDYRQADETQLDTTSNNLPVVLQWFCEQVKIIDDFGYPVGTLLHYNYR